MTCAICELNKSEVLVITKNSNISVCIKCKDIFNLKELKQ